jgi:hypothetical protein
MSKKYLLALKVGNSTLAFGLFDLPALKAARSAGLKKAPLRFSGAPKHVRTRAPTSTRRSC